MAEWDLTPKLFQYLDRHMILPLLDFLLEKKLYSETDLLSAKVEVASRTKMVDYWAGEYKLLHSQDPEVEDVESRRSSVYAELNEAQSACGPLLTVLNDEAELANELREAGNFTLEHLSSSHGVTESNIDSLYRFAKLNFECGRYRDCADYLFYYRLLAGAKEEERAFWALWGKCASEILMVNCEAALQDLNALKEAIDQRIHVDQLEQLQQRTWIIHWSLFIFFNLPNGRNLMIDFLLQDKLLNTIQMNCPHILRYLTTSIIINKRRKTVLKDIVRVLQQEKTNYTDPIIQFLLTLYVDFDFPTAHAALQQCNGLLQNDFFLGFIADEFMENARLLLFETYCRIHKTIEMAEITKGIGTSWKKANTASEEKKEGDESGTTTGTGGASSNSTSTSGDADGSSSSESVIVELIREARVEAKIDSKNQHIVMSNEYPSVYQQVIDKTKSLAYRSQQMQQGIEKKLAQKAVEAASQS